MKESNNYYRCLFLSDHTYLSLESVLVFIVFLKPGSVEDISVLDLFWNLARFGLSFLFISLYITKSFSAVKYPVLLFLIAIVSTFLHNGLYSKALAHWFPTIGLMCWLDYNKQKLRNIAHTFFICGGGFIILNALSMVAFPDGIWIRAESSSPVWLLGQKQEFITCFLPTVLCGVIDNYHSDKVKSYTKIVILSILISFLVIRPMGLFLTLFSVLILMGFDRIKANLFSAKFLFLLFLLFEIIGILIAYIYSKLTLFQLFLASIETNGLDKSQTLGVRFQMWIYGLESFKDSPLIGFGQVTESYWYKTSGLDFYHSILHNLPLDILFTGGAISLVIYLVWNITIVKELTRYKSFKLSRYMGFFFFSLCLICVTECPYQPMIFALYIFLVNIPYVIAKGYLMPIQK